MEKFDNIKAILFDLDGTLFETAPELSDAVNLMLKDLEMMELKRNEIKNFIGKGAENLIKQSLRLSSKKDPSPIFTKAEKLFAHHYSLISANSLMFDGVKKAIVYLKSKDFLLGCVTNKPAIYTEALMNQSRLSDFMDIIVSGDTTEKKKPDPLPILYALDQLNIEPKDAIMVGDSIVDIEAGCAAGTYIFTVPYGYQFGESIISDKVDHAMSDFYDLTQIIN
ncbi:HAD-IA family hydrolase [Methylophilaceae bacterium]|nr:HAD-IA family hydrolase [bacterium]MDC0931708.1 HAD-IA family hydrolase [Methylophilaceae bacterium]